MNKKSLVIIAILALSSISLKAQWFDFNENTTRVTAGFNTGLVGYRHVGEISDMKVTDIGFGGVVTLVGAWLDFVYVMPDHRFDSHVVQQNWDDHKALVINAGYQIPIYRHYAFVTPLIGLSYVSTGYTEGNNIGIDQESSSIYHKYVSTWSRYDFNYGGALTVVPCKWFELNAVFTAHAVYGGIAFNLMNYN